jgi:hypothetical protein
VAGIAAVIRVARLFVLLCCLSATASHQAAGFSTEGGLTWPNGTTVFSTTVSNSFGGQSLDFAAAMQDWNAATSFRFMATPEAADPCDSAMANGVALLSTACGDAFGSSTLAVTFFQSNSQNFFTHAGIVFNRNISFSSYAGPLRVGPPFGTDSIDFRRVAIHELGHVLGLAHETDPKIPAIMAPAVSDIELPTADDIAGVQFLYVSSRASPSPLLSALLPASRSAQVGGAVTAFATILNSGTRPVTGCKIALASPIPANFTYQTTSPATNQPSGMPNQPADIGPGASQSFVISVTPTSAFDATDAAFSMQCAGTGPATSTVGLNTLLLSGSNVPTPDIVALALTNERDGYVHLQGNSGAIAVATVNLGATGNLVVSADTGGVVLPLWITLCRTDPRFGQCMGGMGTSIPVTIGTNEMPTFAVFVLRVGASAAFPPAISPDPSTKRVFIRFRDSGGVTRGSTSVAVTSF